MIVTSIKTSKILAGEIDLVSLLDIAIEKLENSSVVVITSKIVSLCENNVIPFDSVDREQLILREAKLYLPAKFSKYNHHFTITNHTLIPAAGIDESNSNGNYVLWPKDVQKTANRIRVYLKKRFMLSEVGVIISDSTSRPLRRGITGIVLAHSGFLALKNYVGKPDLFDRPFNLSQADIAGGLAASAVLQMGEGNEQTPIAILSDLPFVQFQDRNPNNDELNEINLTLEDDLFAPFLTAVKWEKGQGR